MAEQGDRHEVRVPVAEAKTDDDAVYAKVEFPDTEVAQQLRAETAGRWSIVIPPAGGVDGGGFDDR